MPVVVIENIDLQTPESIVSTFKEQNAHLIKFSLDKIHDSLPMFWPEFVESLPELKCFATNSAFEHAKLAALIGSKISFLASDLEQALELALLADDYFNPKSTEEYNCAIINKCFERCVELYQRNYDGDHQYIPPRMNAIISEIIDENIRAKNYFDVVGLAMEMRSIEVIEKTILISGKEPAILEHCINCVNCFSDKPSFRQEVIQTVLALYATQENHNLSHVAKYLFMLDDREKLISLLKRLIYNDVDSNTNLPVALQICFDLYDNCQQDFLATIISDLQTEASIKTAELIESGIIDVSNENATETYLTTTGVDYKTLPYLSSLHKMVSILDGTQPNLLQMDFLIRSLRYDLQRLATIISESRSLLTGQGSALYNALVHMGTTSDTLMRINVEWMTRSVGWTRFIMVAAMGIIHRGHGASIFNILNSYLPSQSNNTAAYAEGGSLYGLGLSCANNGINFVKYFTPHLTSSTSNLIQFGASLGLGLAAFGTNFRHLYNNVYDVLQQDDTFSAEGAAIACGMIMAASINIEIYENLKKILMTSKHDKVKRAVALGISMLFAFKTSQANPYIEELINNQSPIVRMTAIYTVAMAYAGTNDPYAVKVLWSTTVSDTNEEVQRISMIALGMVMFRERDKFFGIAAMFLYGHSVVLRCGAILAIGMTFASTGCERVLSILRPLITEPIMLIRQVTYIACALILVQNNDKDRPISRDVRSDVMAVKCERSSEMVGRFGAYIAFGIMDAGGRNQTFTLETLEGHTRLLSVVGFMVFQTYWYSYPMSCFVTLCFVPTSIILVNPDLEMPEIRFACSGDLEQFAYPEHSATVHKEIHEKTRFSQLSHSLKSRNKQRRTYHLKDTDLPHTRAHSKKSRHVTTSAAPVKVQAIKTTSDIEKPPSVTSIPPDQLEDPLAQPLNEKVTEIETEELIFKVEPTKPEITPDAVHDLQNPCRVVPRQLPFMSIDESSLPLETVKPVSCGGIIVCYMKNGADQLKLRTLSTSDRKPMEENMPPLKDPTPVSYNPFSTL